MKVIQLLSLLACTMALAAGPSWAAEEKKPCCEATVEAAAKCAHACCKKAAEQKKVCKRCHPDKKAGDKKK